MLKRRGEEAVKSDAQFDKASSTGVRVRDRPESRDEAPSLGEQLRLFIEKRIKETTHLRQELVESREDMQAVRRARL